ncbi:hypothetical protein VPHD354_0165 [Vibrio phage D354]
MVTLREELQSVVNNLYQLGECKPNSPEELLADSITKIMERHEQLLADQEAFPEDYPLVE